MVSPVLTRPSDPVVRTVVPPRSPVPVGRRWSLRRTHVVVASGAAVIAVWLGGTAPSVSPVAPPVPAAVTAVPTTAVAGDPAPDGAAAVPQDPAAIDGPRGGRGRGR